MDWIELIIFAVVIFFGLLFGDRKKKRPAARPRRPGSEPTTSPAATADDPLTIAEQIFERMRREEQAPREPESWDAHLEPMHTGEAASLETLEPAGEASHSRFHERYIEPLAETPVSQPHKPRVYLTPRTGRDAIVWMAVLGRPRGLE